jgi:hypothetical protein
MAPPESVVSLRALIALIALLAAAVGALVWLNKHPAPKEAAAPDPPLLASFTDDGLAVIELACDTGTVALAHGSAGAWRLTRPIDAEADPRRVGELVTALQDAKARKIIAASASDLASFGLAPASCAVTLRRTGAVSPLTLKLGRTSPVGTERYATADGTKVVLTDGSLFSVVSRGSEPLREKRLVPVAAERITHLTLARPSDRVALAIDGDACRVEAPVADAGSSAACESLARAVATMELSAPFGTSPPKAARPDRCIRIDVAVKGEASPRVAYVAAAGIEGKRIAWRDGGGLSGLADDDKARELERPAASLRSTQVLSLSTPDVRRLILERPAARLELARAGDGAPWTGSDGKGAFPVDGARIDALLVHLRTLNSEQLLPSPPASPPTGTIVVVGAGGELARLTYGSLPRDPKSGSERLWMTSAARAGAVFAVPSSWLGPIPATSADLAPSPSPSPSPA